MASSTNNLSHTKEEPVIVPTNVGEVPIEEISVTTPAPSDKTKEVPVIVPTPSGEVIVPPEMPKVVG